MSSHHIVFDQVEVKYNDYVYGLRGVSLAIDRGDFAFFCGKTGTGKSTLLKLLTREVRPTSGSVKLWGLDLEDIPDDEIPLLRRTMGIVPQDYGLLPRKRVWENVAYAMRAVGATKKEVRERVPALLESVNIGHRADAFPHQLSGGEQQRVAIGRALINSPKLLIADEPTGNLDPEHSWEIMELLLKLNQQGTTVLVASHDMVVVERMGKRVVTLAGGRVVSDETPVQLPFEEVPIVVGGLDFEDGEATQEAGTWATPHPPAPSPQGEGEAETPPPAPSPRGEGEAETPPPAPSPTGDGEGVLNTEEEKPDA